VLRRGYRMENGRKDRQMDGWMEREMDGGQMEK
jgi:hypothetical protein